MSKFRTLLLVLASVLCAEAYAQDCSFGITPVPPYAKPIPSKGKQFLRGQIPVSANISFEILSTSLEPAIPLSGDTTLIIKRGAKTIQNIPLAQTLKLGGNGDVAVLSIGTVCTEDNPVYVIALGQCCTMTSADYYLLLAPRKDVFTISSPLPVSGGTLELSKSQPGLFRTWDNLHEGSCEACETHYLIRTYRLTNGKLKFIRKHTTKQLYTSNSPIFNDTLRLRIVP